METYTMKQDNANELELASTALRHIIGKEVPVSSAQLIGSFSNNETLATLYTPYLGIEQVKDCILSKGAERSDPLLSTQAVVANGLTAFWKWAKVGFGMVDGDCYRERLAACGTCEKYVDAPDNAMYNLAAKLAQTKKVCSMCGCMMEKKAWLASENCPLPHSVMPGFSKWQEPIREKGKKQRA